MREGFSGLWGLDNLPLNDLDYGNKPGSPPLDPESRLLTCGQRVRVQARGESEFVSLGKRDMIG
jgi:hypothetical protein